MSKCVEITEAVPDPAVRQALEEFWPMFFNSRSLCVYLPEKMIGREYFAPGTFYCATSPYNYVQLKVPLSEQVRSEHNRIAAWTNENFFIRLWAILASHGFTKPIRSGIRGSAEVKLLKKLREHFAHGSGQYDKRKQEHRNLHKELRKLFTVPDEHDGIPTNIDTVLEPMYKRCLDYVEDVLNLRPRISDS